MKKGVIQLLCTMAIACTAFTASAGVRAEEADKSELVVAYSRKNPIDPFNYAWDLTRNIVEPLVSYESAGRDVEPVLKLAESYECSEDQLVWTFHLCDAQFADGTPVTADDVVFSLTEALNTPLGASTYVGYEAAAKDDKTVDITVPYFSDNTLYYISTLPILNSAAYESEGQEAYFNKLAGSGPYMLESYDDATGLAVMVANPNYRGEQPEIQKVTFRYIPDQNTTLIALKNGEVDFAQIFSADYDSAVEDESLRVQFSEPILGNYLIFNTEVAPVDNQKVRQAILYAIDNAAVAYMSEVEGNYEILDGFFLDEWGVEKPENFTSYTYDPEKAMELLAEAGVETPLDLGEIGITSDQKAMWEAIAAYLNGIGITVQLSTLETSVWLDNFWKGDFVIASMNDSDMGSGGYANICDIFSIQGIEYGYNYSRYADEHLDELLMAAAGTSDKEEVNKYFGEAINIINDQALWGVVYTYGRIYAGNKDLAIEVPSTLNIDFSNVSWQ